MHTPVIQSFLLILVFCLFGHCTFSQSSDSQLHKEERKQWLLEQLDIAKQLYANQRILAAEKYFKVLESSLEEDEEELRAMLHHEWGAVLFDSHHYDKVLEQLAYAQLYGEKVKDSFFLARIQINMGNVYGSKGDHELALEAYQKAQSYSLNSDNKEFLAYLYGNMGVAYARVVQDSAIYYFNLAMQLASAFEDDNFKARTEMSIAQFYLNSASPDSAKIHFNKSIAYAKKVSKNLVGRVLTQYHTIRFTIEPSQESSRILDSMSTVFFENELWGDYHDLHRGLAEYYRGKNNFELAFLNKEKEMKGFKEMKLIENEVNQNKIGESFDKLEAENEKIILSKDEQIAAQNKLNMLYLGLGAASLILVVLLLLFLKKKRAHVKTLEYQMQLKEKETELLQSLKQKNKELLTNTARLTESNEVMKTTIQRLKKVLSKSSMKTENEREINSIVQELKQEINSSTWDEFERHFLSIAPEFYTNLFAEFPNLTTNDKRIAAFARLNLSTKEISNLTRQSTNSIDVAKYRLRKKLGISNVDIDLSNFLSKY